MVEHIYPAGLRFRANREVTREDVERVVAALDRKIAKSSISAKTAKNIWGTLTKLFDDATNAKPSTGLRVLDRNPAAGVRGPEDDDAESRRTFGRSSRR